MVVSSIVGIKCDNHKGGVVVTSTPPTLRIEVGTYSNPGLIS